MGGLGLSGGGVCRGRCALSGGGFFAVFIFRLTDAENEFAEKLFKILRRLRELDVAVFRQGRFVRAGLQREVAATEQAFAANQCRRIRGQLNAAVDVHVHAGEEIVREQIDRGDATDLDAADGEVIARLQPADAGEIRAERVAALRAAMRIGKPSNG